MDTTIAAVATTTMGIIMADTATHIDNLISKPH